MITIQNRVFFTIHRSIISPRIPVYAIWWDLYTMERKTNITPQYYLTNRRYESIIVTISGCGEVWYRAWFGSKRPWVRIPSLRPKNNPPPAGGLFFDMTGFERTATALAGAKKCPGDTFLVRGRIPCSSDAPLVGVDDEQAEFSTSNTPCGWIIF